VSGRPRIPLPQQSFGEDGEVDFVVVGSGASGGVLAAELSRAGFDVVVLEQGPWRTARDFDHDEFGHWILGSLTGDPRDDPQTFRSDPSAEAQVAAQPPPLIYARGVGGSSVHFTANYWRLRPVDFAERSRWGSIEGTGFVDWPLTYDDLEPYYSRAEWEVGVSGTPGPFDPPRSRGYPMPPLPVKSSGVLFERGARALGWNPQPAPMAILSEAYDGRAPCMHCGFCMGFGCEVDAKSSTLASMIPKAVATGHCEIRPESTVIQVETSAAGRATGVVYLDAEGVEHRQRARVVVLAANGAETPRLLLMSTSSRFPDGLANGSGLVGKYLMFNGQTASYGLFENPLNEYKSVQVTRILLDFYDADPRRGFYGGGGMDGRMFNGPLFFALGGMPPDVPRWGEEYRRALGHHFVRTMEVAGHTTSLPVESNSVSLDPVHTDRWGRPAIRTTYHDHPDDLSMMRFFVERGEEILHAAGAEKVWSSPVGPQTLGAHLLGTCRMGTDPAASVVDPYHRSHEVPNLFICDGSSMVSSGRGQPTLTIQALAFRAADHLARFAGAGEM
jgi:choline dehydrogenase-like flavoprotein